MSVNGLGQEAAQQDIGRDDIPLHPPEKTYDDLALLAAHICGTPMALVSFVTGGQRWFKAQVGMTAGPIPNEESFCVHAPLEAQALLVVPDALEDGRFKHSPLVTDDPHIRFYAGVSLTDAEGAARGSLCVLDRVPRELSRAQREALRALARQVMSLLELRRTAAELEESEERFRAFMDNSPVVAFIKDAAGRMIYANKRFERRFKLERAGWLNKDDFELWPAEVARPLREHDLKVLAGVGKTELVETVPTPDGGTEHWRVAKFPLTVGDRKLLAGTAVDITEMKRYERDLEAHRHALEKANAHLAALSLTDSLTGLENRRAFDKELSRAVSEAARRDAPLSLLLIDVDKFKSYNDAFGHPAGDEALRRVAQLLVAQARRSDRVARYGGEEFAVILPDTALAGAHVLAERYRRAVESSTWSQRGITVSIGVAARTQDESGADLVAAADAALYRAKAEGRNCIMSSA